MIYQTEDNLKIAIVFRETSNRLQLLYYIMKKDDKAGEEARRYFSQIFQQNPKLAHYIKGTSDNMVANTVGELLDAMNHLDRDMPLDKGLSVEIFKAKPVIVYGKTQFNVDKDTTKNTVDVCRVR